MITHSPDVHRDHEQLLRNALYVGIGAVATFGVIVKLAYEANIAKLQEPGKPCPTYGEECDVTPVFGHSIETTADGEPIIINNGTKMHVEHTYYLPDGQRQFVVSVDDRSEPNELQLPDGQHEADWILLVDENEVQAIH